MNIKPRRIRLTKLRLASVIVAIVTVLYQACATQKGGVLGFNDSSFEGQVVAITDGDTIKVLDADKHEHKVRFAFIDAPEKGMEYGMAARKALSNKLYRHMVKVTVKDTDRYGRTVGQVWLDDRDINYEQVKEGWAWHYTFYAQKTQSPADFDRYQAAEKQAREQQYGLWAGNEVMPPWDWRRNRRVGQVKPRKPVDADEVGDEAVGE